MIPENKGWRAIIESIITQMESERQARYNDLLKKIHYYEGTAKQREQYLLPYLRISGGDIPFTFTNLTKKIIRRISNVYREAPTRTFDKDYPKYPDLIGNKNIIMKQAERMAHLLGVPALRVYWDYDRKTFGYKIIRYYEPLFDKDVITPVAIMYPLNTGTDKPEYWVYWDNESHYVMNARGIPVKNQEEFGVNPEMVNPYGILPFAFLHEEEIYENFFTGGADDIVEANNKIDLALTNLNYGIRYGTFKQPYAKGENLQNIKVEVGYNKIMMLQGDPSRIDVGVIDLNANIESIINGIKFQIQLIERNNDLSINWGIEGAPSGFSLVVQNIDLLSAWEDDIDQCREWEADIYEIEKVIAQVDAGISLPERMSVDFAEVAFPIDPAEERAKWEWEWQHGLSSKIDYLKQKSPDTPEDELRKRLEENAKLKSEIATLEKPRPLSFAERLGVE